MIINHLYPAFDVAIKFGVVVLSTSFISEFYARFHILKPTEHVLCDNEGKKPHNRIWTPDILQTNNMSRERSRAENTKSDIII